MSGWIWRSKQQEKTSCNFCFPRRHVLGLTFVGSEEKSETVFLSSPEWPYILWMIFDIWMCTVKCTEVPLELILSVLSPEIQIIKSHPVHKQYQWYSNVTLNQYAWLLFSWNPELHVLTMTRSDIPKKITKELKL